MESDSSNAIAWVSNKKANLWIFQFHFNVSFVMCLDPLIPWRIC